MTRTNLVIDDESAARFEGLHVKRYDADLIVMTNIDIIKNDLGTGDNQSSLQYSMAAEGRFILIKEHAIHSERGFIGTI